MKETELLPIPPSERIYSIDSMRGLSIFGIFLVNMTAFSSPALYIQPEVWWPSTIDKLTIMLIDIFAQANFYTLFSFLFGYGMVIFQERTNQKGYSFFKLVNRRLLVLLGFGCIHAFLIWHGDILISYAIVGAIFLIFSKAKPFTMLVLSSLMIFVPTLLFFSLLMLVSFIDPLSLNLPHNNQLAMEVTEIYRSGSYVDITLQRIQDWYYVNNLENAFFLLFALLPMFLLGAFIAKKRWFSHPERHGKFIRRLWLVSIFIALPIKLVPYLTVKNIATEYLQDSIGGAAAAIFYATTIVLLSEKKEWKKRLAPLAFVGRLSLSNYLFQSLICTFIFYSYGLGLYGKIGPFHGLLLTVVIFFIQLLISKWWLLYYQYGPVEWIWRSLTYGRIQRFVVNKKRPSM